MEEYEIVVIGGGASGLMAAYQAAKRGKRVLLIERNEKLGKKIYITGKGRCNFTNDCSPDEFLTNVVSNPKFLMGAIRAFPPERTLRFFEEAGMHYKIERGNRAFPISDHASDVTKVLEKACRSVGVQIHLNERVLSVRKQDTMSDVANSMFDIVTSTGRYFAYSVIIATGGVSYPTTGSTGDGYSFASSLGHSIVPTVPALVGIRLKNPLAPLSGLSLKNVALSVKEGEKVLHREFGEMLFTHSGISGPIVLTISSLINRKQIPSLSLSLDLKPALSFEQLEQRILRDFDAEKNKSVGNVFCGLLPKNLVPFVLAQAGVSPQKTVNSVTKEERKGLLFALKCFIMKPTSLLPVEEAIVTAGGVSVKEVNPKTMESKRCPHLYFCGEVLDLDALTGGFNLQIAFATGYAAGNAV